MVNSFTNLQSYYGYQCCTYFANIYLAKLEQLKEIKQIYNIGYQNLIFCKKQ